MQNSRFVVLTGHLSDYPLGDLVGILRHQRKTGRLTIEYPKSPGLFFFQEGVLVDAQLNDLSGLQAICVALAQPDAAFNFNPLIRPPRRSIAPSLQRVVSELLGCWDESDLQIDVATAAPKRSLPATESIPITPPHISVGSPQPLQLPAAPPTAIQKRFLPFVTAAVILLVGLSTVIALSRRLNSGPVTDAATLTSLKSAQAEMQKPSSANESLKTSRKSEQLHRKDNQVATSSSKQKNESSQPSTQSAKIGSDDQTRKPVADSVATVKVIMQIENGRVLNASIADHKSGMDSYEGLALRIAKQRRYPSNVTGQESIKIAVAGPN